MNRILLDLSNLINSIWNMHIIQIIQLIFNRQAIK